MPKIPNGPLNREQLEALASGTLQTDRLTDAEARQVMSYSFVCAQMLPWAAWVDAYARRLQARAEREENGPAKLAVMMASVEARCLANDMRLGREPQNIAPDPPPRRTP